MSKSLSDIISAITVIEGKISSLLNIIDTHQSKIDYLSIVKKHNTKEKNRLSLLKEYKKVDFYIPTDMVGTISIQLKFKEHNIVVKNKEEFTHLIFFPGKKYLKNYRKITGIINSIEPIILDLISTLNRNISSAKNELASFRRDLKTLQNKNDFLVKEFSKKSTGKNKENDIDKYLNQLSDRTLLFIDAMDIYKLDENISYIGALRKAIANRQIPEDAESLENDFTKWRKRSSKK